jgi:hypothetical protein
MTPTLKTYKTVRTCGLVILLAYLGFSEIRIKNLEAEANLSYDAPSCCIPGKTGREVDQCFEQLGYKPRRLDETSERVQPNLLLTGFSFRETYLVIQFGADDKLRSYALEAVMSAL